MRACLHLCVCVHECVYVSLFDQMPLALVLGSDATILATCYPMCRCSSSSNACMYTYIHIYIHTYIHTYLHTYIAYSKQCYCSQFSLQIIAALDATRSRVARHILMERYYKISKQTSKHLQTSHKTVTVTLHISHIHM
jgi:hypothetical protein